MTAPEGTPLARVEGVVRGKLFWVFSKLAEKALLFQPAAPKEYASGKGFHYPGRSSRLLLTDETRRAVGECRRRRRSRRRTSSVPRSDRWCGIMR